VQRKPRPPLSQGGLVIGRFRAGRRSQSGGGRLHGVGLQFLKLIMLRADEVIE
jgi:hypothetical protein